MASKTHQFYELTPEKALSSIENEGYPLTGRFFQLNSYENRVFSVELDRDLLEDDVTHHEIIAKFYRPERWSYQAIQEEHDFLFELEDSGLPAVAPLKNEEGQSIFYMNNIMATVFPKAMGRMPQDLNAEEYKSIGRLLARLHNVGARSEAQARPTLDTESFGDESLQLIEQLIVPDLKKRYLEAADEILDIIDDLLEEETYIRIHGDCHKGNLLQTDPIKGPKEYFFVDFDDFRTGPPVYDFWMLLLGEPPTKVEAFLNGYTEFRDFERKSLKLMEPFRALRMIYYSAWIIRRWEDPNFKKLFPNFNTYNYWAEECDAIEGVLNKVRLTL